MTSIQSKKYFLTPNEMDTLRQLFFHGPTWDGDISSKVGRDGLVSHGLAIRNNGWNTLSEEGFITAVDAGYGERKQIWEAKRRSKL